MSKFMSTTAGAVDKKAPRGLAVLPESFMRTMVAVIDACPTTFEEPRYFEWTTDGGNTICVERVFISSGVHTLYITAKDED